jgi:hypothetical protein
VDFWRLLNIYMKWGNRFRPAINDPDDFVIRVTTGLLKNLIELHCNHGRSGSGVPRRDSLMPVAQHAEGNADDQQHRGNTDRDVDRVRIRNGRAAAPEHAEEHAADLQRQRNDARGKPYLFRHAPPSALGTGSCCLRQCASCLRRARVVRSPEREAAQRTGPEVAIPPVDGPNRRCGLCRK